MKKFIVFCFGVFVILLTLRPLFNSTFFPIHDFTHVARLVELDKALGDGHFPVRWVRDLGYGYGMPLFSFYGPMPFYFAELFHLVGFSALVSIKAMLIVMAILAFIGMYLFSSSYFGVLGGLISATAFLVVPYRALDLFVRGAFNELFALSLVPFVLYFIYRVRATQSWFDVGKLSLTLVAFFTSHNLMTLMFFPLIYGFGVLQLFAGGVSRFKYMIMFHVGLVLAVCASAFYLLPSFFEKGWTQVDKLIGGYGMYVYHFLYIRQWFQERWGYGGSFGGPEDGMSFHLGWVHLALAGVGVLFWILRSKSKYSRLIAIVSVGATITSLFMTIFKSQFIWDRIPFLVYFQFPWRFLSISAVLLPFLAGSIVFALRNLKIRKFLGVMILSLLIGLNLQFFQPVKLLDDPNAMYYEDPLKIQESMSDILPDYIPIWMQKWQKPFQTPFEITSGDQQNIEVLVDRTHEKLLKLKLNNPSELLIRIAWFPNWIVYDNGLPINHVVDNSTGFFTVQLGPGDHLVGIKFEDTILRTRSNILSAIAFIAIAGIMGYAQHRRRSA